MSQQESQQMNDGHSETIEGELTPLWSSRLTACVCVRARMWITVVKVWREHQNQLVLKNTLWPVPSILTSVLRNSLVWFDFVFPGRKKKNNWKERKETFERWRASDWRMTHPECGSDVESLQCLSHHAAATERGTEGRVSGEGGRQREGEENKGSWEDERKMVAVPLLSFHLWLAGVCQRSIWSSSFVDAFLAIIMWCKDHTQADVHTSDHTHASV